MNPDISLLGKSIDSWPEADCGLIESSHTSL